MFLQLLVSSFRGVQRIGFRKLKRRLVRKMLTSKIKDFTKTFLNPDRIFGSWFSEVVCNIYNGTPWNLTISEGRDSHVVVTVIITVVTTTGRKDDCANYADNDRESLHETYLHWDEPSSRQRLGYFIGVEKWLLSILPMNLFIFVSFYAASTAPFQIFL